MTKSAPSHTAASAPTARTALVAIPRRFRSATLRPEAAVGSTCGRLGPGFAGVGMGSSILMTPLSGEICSGRAEISGRLDVDHHAVEDERRTGWDAGSPAGAVGEIRWNDQLA